MNSRETKALIKRIKAKCGTKTKRGTYARLAERLSALRPDSPIKPTGVYAWYVRGDIPAEWMPYALKLDSSPIERIFCK